MINFNSFTDEKLVEYVRTQDQESYRELVKRFQSKLLRYATYLTNDEHRAADVVQESFIKAYVNLNSFDINKSFSTWIYRIVHNEAINIIKKYQKEISRDDKFDIPDDKNMELDFTQKELRNQIKKCLKQLSLAYREPISLMYLEGYDYKQISDILRIPIGTVGTRINRAKKMLAKLCQNLKP
ncbi:hypothetical protein COX08_00650 [Candidatus Beckwithbacteria bacterium CG23_combo_of_CG06-09_8_20_14_all_34_8]|uniref:RNA polymerase subunit sigma-24 n=1 Tax=Candidatus Beckwithbacteria bacterium CG23_combo_of_CG06-09_8_20_14_all_34_8 TaxID=1974497 RepID=A0A2H0B731_9BACT|nr:MAG: hypothetical protein COX08_00650 [Candidatus Beckwithbacteria bacterium CG23_combo_of_CG06-09_8_20_14_all_34_8]